MLPKLTDLQLDLNELAESLRCFRSFEAEFRRCSKGKPYRIWSHLAWRSVTSLYRTILIDLAAWYSAVERWLQSDLQHGDVFGKLRTSKRLAAKIVATDPTPDPQDPKERDWLRRHHESLVFESRGEALKRLFGKRAAARKNATHAEVNALATRMGARRKTNLKTLRDFHAHRIGWTEDVKHLRSEHLARRIASAGDVLNDIRLLLDSSTYHVPSMAPSDNDANARDMVDLILVGTIYYSVEQWQTAKGPWLHQKRDAYYVEMHKRPRKKKKADFFNTHVERAGVD